jgi:hypothetical protein
VRCAGYRVHGQLLQVYPAFSGVSAVGGEVVRFVCEDAASGSDAAAKVIGEDCSAISAGAVGRGQANGLVVDQALAQRADGGVGHGRLLSRVRGWRSSFSRQEVWSFHAHVARRINSLQPRFSQAGGRLVGARKAIKCIVIFAFFLIDHFMAIGPAFSVEQSATNKLQVADDSRVSLPPDFDPQRIVLLYSADDALCRPLGALYNELSHKDAKRQTNPTRPNKEWIWEDSYPARFRGIGLKTPPHTESVQDEVQMPWHQHGLAAYYNLSLEPGAPPRTVYVHDVPYGRTSVGTNVFIFKPGYSAFDYHDDGDPADVVDFGVLFGTRTDQEYDKFYNVRHPYLFRKNDVYQKFSWISFATEMSQHQPIKVDIGFIRNAPVIQRVYLFNGHVIFTAQQSSATLVYRLIGGSTMDDVCYFAGNIIELPHDGVK